MSKRKVELETVRRVLMGADDEPGVFERTIGFRTATTAIKGVHIMNDVAQTILGGAPQHKGDFLCMVLRPDKEGEGTSERELRSDPRFGGAFNRAFPQGLGARRVDALRRAAGLVLNHDGGVFKAGDSMASALATHRALLGSEGFRRFQVGPYIARILTPAGRARLAELLGDARDPVSRAFRPLLLDAPLEERPRRGLQHELTALDLALGEGLSRLLTHPLSKPATLRAFSLAANLGVVLKILGIGREGGRPLLLALATPATGQKAAREEAVATLRRSVEAMAQAFADNLPSHPFASDLWERRGGGEVIEVKGGAPLEAVALQIINEARETRTRDRTSAAKEGDFYWPDTFALRLGQRIGCIQPKVDKAGWGKHLALTPELVEVLTLMLAAPGERVSWRGFWTLCRTKLGVLIGAHPSAERVEMERSGVPHVSVEALTKNADALLALAVRRGVARRLPDQGAEVGGSLS